MPYFPDINVLHVHVSKAAGTSIGTALSVVSRKECFAVSMSPAGIWYHNTQHMTCPQLLESGLVSYHLLREAKMFVVVRDPLRRFVSSFLYQRQMQRMRGWFPHNRDCLGDLDAYANALWQRYRSGVLAEFPQDCPQHLYLESAPGLPIPVRMKLEELSRDWAGFARLHGLPETLPRENTTPTEDRPEPSAECREKIRAIYRLDYVECGY
jgi:hypothetical protein